jgi:Fe-coproporphyrin III synthase
MNLHAIQAQPSISSLPVLVLFPHSRCDCRCVMCDIWKDGAVRELGLEEVKAHLEAIRKLRVQWVVLSGGEPLLHSHLFGLCDLLRELGIRVTLLSTGLLLKPHAREVATRTNDTIVSLDGPEPIHDQIRRVKGAFARLSEGVADVKRCRPTYSFSCRTTVQRANFRYLRKTVAAARAVGFESLSFLAADVTSTAFNRPGGWNETRQNQIALSGEEIPLLADEMDALIRDCAGEIETGFVRESPEKLRRIVYHFRAHLGGTEAISPKCNAPWVSAVIESDGSVRPCFFHKVLGNIHDNTLLEVLNGAEAIQFRQELDIPTNPICRRCVCSLHLPDGVLT